MDPDKTFANMVEALANGDTEEAREHFEALVEWLERGGFPPGPAVGFTAP